MDVKDRYLLHFNEDEAMERQPMVTVVMPCYNHEKYVRESIESVLNQTYQDFEFIIIENGSTDGSRDIIREYENYEKVKVIYFDVNDCSKLNETYYEPQNSRGKYQAQMFSDDIWMPDKLEKQVKFMEDHPEYDACFTWAEYGDENMNILQDEEMYYLFKQPNRTPAEWLHFFWLNGNCLCAPSILWRMKTAKECYEQFRHSNSYWQLYDLWEWIELLMQGKQFYIYPEVLVNMRRHSSAISYSEMSRFRIMNEYASITVLMLEKMSDEQFIASFSQNFVKADARTHEELVCEKILLLFLCANAELQPMALDFFYRNYADVENVMTEEYKVPKSFFVEQCGKRGFSYLMTLKTQQYKWYDCHVKYLQLLEELYLRGKKDEEYEHGVLEIKRLLMQSLSDSQRKSMSSLVVACENVLALQECLDKVKYEMIIDAFENIVECVDSIREELAYLRWGISEDDWALFKELVQQGKKAQIDLEEAAFPFLNSICESIKAYWA